MISLLLEKVPHPFTYCNYNLSTVSIHTKNVESGDSIPFFLPVFKKSAFKMPFRIVKSSSLESPTKIGFPDNLDKFLAGMGSLILPLAHFL